MAENGNGLGTRLPADVHIQRIGIRTTTVPVSRSRTCWTFRQNPPHYFLSMCCGEAIGIAHKRTFQQNPPHYFLIPCCGEAVGIAHKPLGSL